MATTRKRSTSAGFAPKEETNSVEETLNEATEETIENIEKEEPMPVVLDAIEPVSLRSPVVEPKKETPVVKQQPKLNPPPKRHPRNIPKFSNFK